MCVADLDVFGGLGVEERRLTVLEEECGYPFTEAGHGLGVESPDKKISFSFN